MIDLNLVRQDINAYKKICQLKNKKVDIDKILYLDDIRKSLQAEIDKLKHQQKEFAGRQEYDKAKHLKTQIQKKEEKHKTNQTELDKLSIKLPNFIHPDVPEGKDETENLIINKFLKPTTFDFTPKDHETLGRDLDIIDKETAAKVSGARFAYIKWDLVLLQMALINYTFAILTDKETIQKIIKEKNLNIKDTPFVPILPPAILKMKTMDRMWRLHPMDDRYCLPEDRQVFNGSAEHTIWPMHMDHIFQEEDLPIRYIWYSPSFRREAGTYGKDTKWILRMHQFDKLEMETFSLPEHWEQEQKLLVWLQEHLIQWLEIPYQLMLLCTGDMGGIDYKQYDIETRMPGQNQYRETHSADFMTDFQSRRLNTRVKRQDNTKQFVHMNDATAFALGRIMIAIIENNQTKDGKIKIPKVLQPYINKKVIK